VPFSLATHSLTYAVPGVLHFTARLLIVVFAIHGILHFLESGGQGQWVQWGCCDSWRLWHDCLGEHTCP